MFSSPAVVNGVAYLGSLNGAVYALNAATGATRWVFHTVGGVASSPAVVGGVVYAGSDSDRMYALSAATGARRWMQHTGDRSVRLARGAQRHGVRQFGERHGLRVQAATGARRWRVNLRTEVDAPVAVADGMVYVPGEPGELYALKAATGARVWHALLPGYAVSSPAVAGDVVYLGTDHTDVGDLLAFNAAPASGYGTSRTATGRSTPRRPSPSSVVYWVANGNASATNVATAGNVWSVNLTPTVMRSDSAVADGVVYSVRATATCRAGRGHRQPALGRSAPAARSRTPRRWPTAGSTSAPTTAPVRLSLPAG